MTFDDFISQVDELFAQAHDFENRSAGRGEEQTLCYSARVTAHGRRVEIRLLCGPKLGKWQAWQDIPMDPKTLVVGCETSQEALRQLATKLYG